MRACRKKGAEEKVLCYYSVLLLGSKSLETVVVRTEQTRGSALQDGCLRQPER